MVFLHMLEHRWMHTSILDQMFWSAQRVLTFMPTVPQTQTTVDARHWFRLFRILGQCARHVGCAFLIIGTPLKNMLLQRGLRTSDDRNGVEQVVQLLLLFSMTGHCSVTKVLNAWVTRATQLQLNVFWEKT